MKFLIAPLAVLPSLAMAGLIPLGEHVDIRCHFTSGEWDIHMLTSSGRQEVDAVFLPLSDKPYAQNTTSTSGARTTQPPSSAFAFTGAQPGESIWFAPLGTPGIGEAWPGFDNDQPSGTFGSYIPNDPRVSQTTARPWIRIALVDYEPPHGKSSHFSMWETISQQPMVWMSTFDTQVENAYYLPAGSHTHLNWGFTTPGVHRVTLQASAFLGPGATNPTGPSEPFTLIFAVGTVGRWQAESFDAAQLASPAISALDADPDRDNIPNLLEYAFGTDPLSGSASPVQEGLGWPEFSLVDDGGTLYQTLTYPRRRAGQRLTPDLYQPVFSNHPGTAWSGQDVVVQTADFAPPFEALNADWERVTARRPVPAGESRGFARVGLTLGDGFSPP